MPSLRIFLTGITLVFLARNLKVSEAKGGTRSRDAVEFCAQKSLYNDDFTVDDIFGSYNFDVAPWDWIIAQAKAMNSTTDDNLEIQTCVDPVPDGFLYNGNILYGGSEKLEKENLCHSMLRYSEPMFEEKFENIDTECKGLPINCCDENFQNAGNGGKGMKTCIATESQPPVCPYAYLFNTPSALNYDMSGVLSEKKSIVGPQYKRVVRPVHAKGIACLKATFDVESDLNEEYRYGLFQDTEASFDAILRIGGGSASYTIKDLHDNPTKSLAVKLLNVAEDTYGKTATLPGIPAKFMGPNAKIFFGDQDLNYDTSITNVVDLLAVSLKTISFEDNTAQNTFFFKNAIDLEADENMDLRPFTRSFLDPFSHTFGSPVAFRLGSNKAMRYYWQPCPGELKILERKVDFEATDITNPDFYFDQVVLALGEDSANSIDEFKFCLYLTVQKDACSESIEAHDVNWTTEPVHAATLVIPKQKVTYDGDCENLTFNQLRTIKDHFPLGSLNRLRDTVYPFGQLYRININCRIGASPTCEESNPYQFDDETVRGQLGYTYPSSPFYPLM